MIMSTVFPIFKNMMKLSDQIFGSKMFENGEWGKLNKEELHIFFCSPNIVMVIKFRRLIFAGHIA